jgi:ribosomal protein S18 acetylase RimI-like enzyme
MEITKGLMNDLDHIVEMYILARRDLKQNDIHQWDYNDPSIQMLHNDIKTGNLYVARKGEIILGSVVLDENPEPEYEDIEWNMNEGKSIYLHRLVVHPDYQGEGTGKQLMSFADEYAREHGYSSIRLVAYQDNEVARGLYERFGYEKVGEIYFPRRDIPFLSYEKRI